MNGKDCVFHTSRSCITQTDHTNGLTNKWRISHIIQPSHYDRAILLFITFCSNSGKDTSLYLNSPQKNDHHKGSWQGFGASRVSREALVLHVMNKQEMPLNSSESYECERPYHMINASSNHSVTPHALQSGGHYHPSRDTATPSLIGHMSTNHFIALRIYVSRVFALTDLLAYYWLLCTHTSGAWLRVHGRPQTAGQPQLLNRDSAEGFVQTSVSSPDRLCVPLLPWPPVKNRGPFLT